MRTAIAWGAFVVLTACGSDGRPEINTTQDTVCDDVAEVACFDMYRCCSEGEIEQTLGVSDPRTQAQCVDDVRAICQRQIGAFDFSLKNKHVRFDANIMNTCLEAFVAPADACVTIEAMRPWTEACMDSAWVGIVTNGGQCDFAYECAKDSFCSASRVCTALPGDGMSCATQGCASGLFCDAGTCHPLVGAGGACTSTAQCQDDLFCDTSAATRTCTPLHKIGEACTGNGSCESKTCLPGTCAGTQNTCVTDAGCTGRCADDDSFCTTDAACAPGACSDTGAACTSQVQCTAPATCVFPVACLPGQCTGTIVCAEAHTAVDYCRDAITDLPLF